MYWSHEAVTALTERLQLLVFCLACLGSVSNSSSIKVNHLIHSGSGIWPKGHRTTYAIGQNGPGEKQQCRQ